MAAKVKKAKAKPAPGRTTLARKLKEARAERDEALAQRAASAEILRIINRSRGDLTPVFSAMLKSAMRLCDAAFGGLLVPEGEFIRYVTLRNVPKRFADFLATNRVRLRTMLGATFRDGAVVHIADLSKVEAYRRRIPVTVSGVEDGGIRTMLVVPLLKDGNFVGALTFYRKDVRPYTKRQIALVQDFAAQAVIAMENARLLDETSTRNRELVQSLERQTATSDILHAIAASPGDADGTLKKIAETTARLFAASGASFRIAEGNEFKLFGGVGRGAIEVTKAIYEDPSRRTTVNAPGLPSAVIRENRQVQVPDLDHIPPEMADWPGLPIARAAGTRTIVGTPLRVTGSAIGALVVYRDQVRPFDTAELQLLQSFADQAAIAIENARLLTELRARTDDLQQSLEYQTATSEVLKVISRSTFDLTPVLQYVLETAMRLCRATHGSMFRLDGDLYRWAAGKGLHPAYEEIERATPITAGEGTVVGRAALHRKTVQILDAWEDPLYTAKEDARLTGAHTMLGVPLLREGVPIGVLGLARGAVDPFTDKEIALVTTFADQAVIAIENARLLTELDRRQAELSVTFDNMGDAVIMFDKEQRLAAWNRNFQHMLDIADDFLAAPRTYPDFVEYLTRRGEFGVSPAPDLGPVDGEVRPIRYERARPDGRVLEVRRNPVPGGGVVFIYSDITERKRAEASLHAAREAAEAALVDLKAAQGNLIQAEKMASLGQLTAGIAHEIKNPLNFVNNFANLSNELLGELKETAAPAFAALDADKRDEIDETIAMLTGNLEKIQEHGRRADGIVRSMLAHSRGGSGDRREADINALVEESLNLAYHGARAHDQNFNITLERDYDTKIGPIELVPQDITRVFLNLCGNGFYAANKRKRDGGGTNFRPVLKVSTREIGNAVEVRIRDNGTGIPPEVKAKLFQPFFTTKPTGEGTGLGLSISYDIVTQQHGGTIDVDSKVGDFTEFTIRLPRNRQAARRGTA